LVKILRTFSCSNLSSFFWLNIEAQNPELYIKGFILGVILWKKGAFYNNFVLIGKEIKNIRILRLN